MVSGEIARSSRDRIGFGLRKWLRKTIRPPGPADPAHLLRDLDRVGHDADQVGRVDDIEGVVRKFEIGGVHLQQPQRIGHVLPGGALPRLLEHGRGEIDAGDRGVPRIQRQVDAGADADLEHAVLTGDAHPLDRLQSAGMQRRAEGQVVHLRELVVHALDKIVLDGSYRERARPGVGSGNQVFFALVLYGRIRPFKFLQLPASRRPLTF